MAPTVDEQCEAVGKKTPITDPVFYPFSVRSENRHAVLAGFMWYLGRYHLGDDAADPELTDNLRSYFDEEPYGIPMQKYRTHGKANNGEDVQRLLLSLTRPTRPEGYRADSKIAVDDEAPGSQVIDKVVSTELLVRGASADGNLLINPLTLTSGWFSGASSQYSPARAFLLEMLIEGAQRLSDKGLIDALCRELRTGDDDVLSALVDALIAPGRWPEHDARTVTPSERRLVTRFQPVFDLAQEVRMLLDAHEDADLSYKLDRALFTRLFRNLLCLRLAQYHLHTVRLANEYARALREVAGGGKPARAFVESLKMNYFDGHEAMGLRLGAPLIAMLEPEVMAFPRNMRLIHLAKIVAGVDDEKWEHEGAAALLERKVLTSAHIRAHDEDKTRGASDSGRYVSTQVDYLKQLLYWKGEDERGGCAKRSPGSEIVISLSDDLLTAMVYIVIGKARMERPGARSVRLDELIEYLGTSGFEIDTEGRESIATRLSNLGLIREMPDAERFREVVLP